LRNKEESPGSRNFCVAKTPQLVVKSKQSRQESLVRSANQPTRVKWTGSRDQGETSVITRDWQPSNNIPRSANPHKKRDINRKERNAVFRSLMRHIQPSGWIRPVYHYGPGIQPKSWMCFSFRSALAVSLQAERSLSSEPRLPLQPRWTALAMIGCGCVLRCLVSSRSNRR